MCASRKDMKNESNDPFVFHVEVSLPIQKLGRTQLHLLQDKVKSQNWTVQGRCGCYWGKMVRRNVLLTAMPSIVISKWYQSNFKVSLDVLNILRAVGSSQRGMEECSSLGLSWMQSRSTTQSYNRVSADRIHFHGNRSMTLTWSVSRTTKSYTIRLKEPSCLLYIPYIFPFNNDITYKWNSCRLSSRLLEKEVNVSSEECRLLRETWFDMFVGLSATKSKLELRSFWKTSGYNIYYSRFSSYPPLHIM